MRISMNRELENLETHIPFPVRLAPSARILVCLVRSGGSARLYRPRGGKTSNTANGCARIAEALIATAIGLFAAIPAVRLITVSTSA